MADGSLNLNGNDGGYDNWAFGGPSYNYVPASGYVTFGAGGETCGQ